MPLPLLSPPRVRLHVRVLCRATVSVAFGRIPGGNDIWRHHFLFLPTHMWPVYTYKYDDVDVYADRAAAHLRIIFGHGSQCIGCMDFHVTSSLTHALHTCIHAFHERRDTSRIRRIFLNDRLTNVWWMGPEGAVLALLPTIFFLPFQSRSPLRQSRSPLRFVLCCACAVARLCLFVTKRDVLRCLRLCVCVCVCVSCAI